MDFVKKFAEEQFEKQTGGNQQQNQSNQQQGSGGFGDIINSFTGGGNQQQQYQQQQQQQQQQGGGGFGDLINSFGGGQQSQQQNYQQQQGDLNVTGGPQYNAPHGSGGASSFGGGQGLPNLDQGAALNAANQHAGNGNQNASLFSQAFGFISNMSKDDKDVDEDDVKNKYEKAYGQGQAGNMSAQSMGAAAAMSALKSFTSGNSDAAKGSTSSGGNDMISKIIGMAISEAAKLFDKSGGAASGTKQDAMTSAGQTMMKLLLKNQVSGMMGGGNSGGLGQLMSMAGKFM